VVGHSWPLTGVTHPPELAGIRVYTLAVYVFFSVSGYLITQSWIRTGRARDYLAKRALRIFPALVAVVAVSVLIVGPVVTTLSVNDYFANPTTWSYFVNVTLVAVYDLPGVFAGHPNPAVNGALWTLGPEFLCYLSVLTLGLIFRRRRLTAAIVMTVAFAVASYASSEPWSDSFTAMTFFGIGSIVASLPRSPRVPLTPAVIALPIWIAAGTVLPQLAIPLAWVALPYIAIAFGQRSAPVLRRAGRFGDISYGTYLWGFVVQQVVIWSAGILPLAVNIAIVVVSTALIALASWHIIEKRALALKPGPRRSPGVDTQALNDDGREPKPSPIV
jgi:peptidoglycan/LPS O-acetylase OafA/YrhL